MSQGESRGIHKAEDGLMRVASRKCGWCLKPFRSMFYQGKRANRCPCMSDYRTPIEKRRDVVLDKYGDDPSAYTPAILAKLARDGLFDICGSFCPAGKLSMAETLAREAAIRNVK